MNPKKQKAKDRRRARVLAEQAWEAANDGNLDLATVNSSWGALAPESINAPTSVLRAVITPSKGATTLSNDCSCSNRATLARFD